MNNYNIIIILICSLATALVMTSINSKAKDWALKILTGYSLYLSVSIAIAYLVILVLKFGK